MKIPYTEATFEYEGGSYSKSSFEPKWIEELIGEKPKVIFEFGSQDGGDGLRYKLAYPDCNVYSFEPSPTLYLRSKRIEKYGVRVYPFGFSNYSGTAPFYEAKTRDNDSICGASSCLPVQPRLQECHPEIEFLSIPIEIACTTIEKFCVENNIQSIDFMQIDVEGMTDRVIEGFGTINPKLLFAELTATEDSYIGAAKTEQVHSVLVSRGYKLITNNNTDSLYILESIK